MSSFILIHPTIWPQSTNVTDRTDRQIGQRSEGIGRTVLQTVAQKLQTPVNLLHKMATIIIYIQYKQTQYYDDIHTIAEAQNSNLSQCTKQQQHAYHFQEIK